MDDIKTKVGKRIKFLRNNLNLSQEQLSFKAELDRTYIASVETGKRNISIIALEKIIKALDIDVPTFFNSLDFK